MKRSGGATNWLVDRARALGGHFRIWTDRSARDPLDEFRDHDVSGGRRRPNSRRYRLDYDRDGFGLDGLLADCRDCHGRIEELVIFHHGSAVDETVAADRIRDIFNKLKVPVCRVVWWSCNAAVSLDVERDGATDFMMRILGAIARCEPCGCDAPIELIWPTAGLCYIEGPVNDRELRTNDGRVLKARWGYRQADGSLGTHPDPNNPHPSPEPSDRDPPYGQPPTQEPGSVLGKPVGRHDG